MSIGTAALLPQAAVLAQSTPWSRKCGIYFLIRGSEIVYVGQSIDVDARIAQHNRDGKLFDKSMSVPCAPAALDRLERRYINMYLPELNNDALTKRLRCAKQAQERFDRRMARAIAA